MKYNKHFFQEIGAWCVLTSIVALWYGSQKLSLGILIVGTILLFPHHVYKKSLFLFITLVIVLTVAVLIPTPFLASLPSLAQLGIIVFAWSLLASIIGMLGITSKNLFLPKQKERQ